MYFFPSLIIQRIFIMVSDFRNETSKGSVKIDQWNRPLYYTFFYEIKNKLIFIFHLKIRTQIVENEEAKKNCYLRTNNFQWNSKADSKSIKNFHKFEHILNHWKTFTNKESI